MIKTRQSKIRRATVELRPSRIRRDPVATEKKAEARSHEEEMWLGVFGIVLFGLAIATATVGFSAITGNGDKAGAAAQASAPLFGPCDGNANCVVDGDTIRMGGATVEIAGIRAPRIQTAACVDEQLRGVKALQRLTALLNGGKVTLGGAVREADGQVRQRVLVDGADIAGPMIDAGVAREPGTAPPDWCGEQD